jgi:hypothetical protein
MADRRRRYPLPARKAILVWIGCAVAGWFVALVSIYSVVRFGDTVTALFRGEGPVIAEEEKDGDKEEGLSDIAPAAGESAPPPPEQDPSD